MVSKAYLDQFEEDFIMFLRCRAEEIVSGGGMILTFIGSIESNNPKSLSEILGRALNDMVLEVFADIFAFSFFYKTFYYYFFLTS